MQETGLTLVPLCVHDVWAERGKRTEQDATGVVGPRASWDSVSRVSDRRLQ